VLSYTVIRKFISLNYLFKLPSTALCHNTISILCKDNVPVLLYGGLYLA